jgi:hypothetical protein
MFLLGLFDFDMLVFVTKRTYPQAEALKIFCYCATMMKTEALLKWNSA